MKTCELMREMGLTEITTLECLQREFQIRTITCTSVPIIPDTSQVCINYDFLIIVLEACTEK